MFVKFNIVLTCEPLQKLAISRNYNLFFILILFLLHFCSKKIVVCLSLILKKHLLMLTTLFIQPSQINIFYKWLEYIFELFWKDKILHSAVIINFKCVLSSTFFIFLVLCLPLKFLHFPMNISNTSHLHRI